MENDFITINHVLKYIWQAQTDEDNAEIANTVNASFMILKKGVFFFWCSILCLVFASIHFSWK